MYLSCKDFENAELWDCKNCCSSCHNEWEKEYTDLFEIEPAGNPNNPKFYKSKHFAEICCSLSNHLENINFDRKGWAIVIKAKRKHERKENEE